MSGGVCVGCGRFEKSVALAPVHGADAASVFLSGKFFQCSCSQLHPYSSTALSKVSSNKALAIDGNAQVFQFTSVDLTLSLVGMGGSTHLRVQGDCCALQSGAASSPSSREGDTFFPRGDAVQSDRVTWTWACGIQVCICLCRTWCHHVVVAFHESATCVCARAVRSRS